MQGAPHLAWANQCANTPPPSRTVPLARSARLHTPDPPNSVRSLFSNVTMLVSATPRCWLTPVAVLRRASLTPGYNCAGAHALGKPWQSCTLPLYCAHCRATSRCTQRTTSCPTICGGHSATGRARCGPAASRCLPRHSATAAAAGAKMRVVGLRLSCKI